MKECDIWEAKHTLTPPTYFQRVRPQPPMIYAPVTVNNVLVNLCHDEYSRCPPVARMQAWRRLRHLSMPRQYASTPTHTFTSNHSRPAPFSDGLASDFVMKCVEVKTVRWPEIWKFIRVCYIVALSDCMEAANEAQVVRVTQLGHVQLVLSCTIISRPPRGVSR